MAYRTKTPVKAFGLVLVALSWAGFLALAGSPEVLLFTLPVFMLTAPLALGYYVGESVISRIAGGRPGLKHPPAVGARRLPDGHTVRFGLLFVTGFAGRAPPVLPV